MWPSLRASSSNTAINSAPIVFRLTSGSEIPSSLSMNRLLASTWIRFILKASRKVRTTPSTSPFRTPAWPHTAQSGRGAPAAPPAPPRGPRGGPAAPHPARPHRSRPRVPHHLRPHLLHAAPGAEQCDPRGEGVVLNLPPNPNSQTLS